MSVLPMSECVAICQGEWSTKINVLPMSERVAIYSLLIALSCLSMHEYWLA